MHLAARHRRRRNAQHSTDSSSGRRLVFSLSNRRSRFAAAVLSVGLLASGLSTWALLGTSAAPAAAAPGNPGTPSAPTVAFQENFENGVGNTPVGLTAYTGASGQKYTADAAWLSNCNGQVRNFNTPSTTIGNCQIESDAAHLNQLAYALGAHAGSATPGANHAVTAYTENNPGVNATEFQTATNIPLASSSGRFLTFSVDTAAVNCNASAPLYQFAFLNQAGTATNVGGQLNACSSGQTVNVPANGSLGAAAVNVGTYTSNGSVLFTGSTLGIRMQNANGSGAGNDAAFDNIRILDVTPQLDKAFTPTAVQTGGTSTLTFTVTNTSELASKAGWGFTDTLPAGLTLANGTVGGTCNATTTAVAGGTSVAVTNGTLAAGQASCTITVQVTSPVAGSFTNGPGNVTETGLNPPGDTTVTFTDLTIPTVGCTTDPAIFNTGYNAATGGQAADGSNDAGWTVAGGVDGFYHNPSTTAPSTNATPVLPPAGTTYAPAQVGKIANVWADSPAGNAQWISANYAGPNVQNQSDGSGDWYYRYQFNLDPAVDPGSFALDMKWLADNSVAGVWVNDIAQSGTNLPQDTAAPYVYQGFTLANAAQTSLTTGWKTGLNTILVQVKSFYTAEGFDAQVQSTVLCPNPAYAVTKTASAATVQPGGNLTYTVTVKNTGNVAYTAANPATISDNLSGVLDDAVYNGDAAVSYSGGSTSAAPTVTGSTLSWSGPLAVGETATITYSVKVDSPDGGDHKLTNAVTPGTNGGGCATAADCTTTTPVQSFSVTKTADRTDVVPGQKVTYTITVKNTGTVDYTVTAPASFSDDLTAVLDDATYNNDATGGATYAAPTLSWSGAVAAGDTVTITYSVTVNDPDTGDQHLNNTVVTPPGIGGDCDPTAGNPACTVNIPSGSYTVAKSASTTSVTAGDTVTYTITVTNTGAIDYTATAPATLTDDLARVLDDATIVSGPDNGATVTGTSLKWSGALAVGQTVVITYAVTVNSPDTGDNVITNTVRPNSPGGSCDPAGSCTTTTDVRAFTVSKSSSPAGAVNPGDKVTYTVTVTNTGTADFTAGTPASFTDDLTAVLDDATYNNDATNGATYAAPTLSWSGAVAAGTSVTVTYTVTVNSPDTGDHTLTNAVVPSGGGTCVPGQCATTNPVQSYTVAKTASAGPAHPGDAVTYTVTVTNTGTADYTAADPASITDDLSKVLDDATYVAGSATNGAQVTGNTLTWSGPLAVGAVQTITYQVLVGPAGTGDGTLTNTVTGDPDKGGSCVTPGGCTTDTPVQAFSVTKTADQTEVTPGQKVTYTVTVTNTGTVDYIATAPASFTDDLSGLLDDATYNNDATNGATYAAPTLSWSGALAVGATVTVTYSVTVNDPDTGDKVMPNTVVTPTGGGGDCPAGTDNAECTVTIPSGSYTVTKTADKSEVAPGATITYTVTVTNTGKTDYTAAKPASFRDDLTNVLDDATYNGDASNGATVAGNTLTWSGAVAAGQTVKVTYSVTVNKPDTGNHHLVNAVVPTGPGGGCDTAGDCLTNTPVASYTVHKTVSTTNTVKPGAVVSYTVTVTNTGEFAYTASTPAKFTDNMSDVLDDAHYNGDATHGATLSGTVLSWSGPLAVGETIDVTYSVTVNNPAAGNHRLVNTVDPAVDGGSCDPSGACDTRTPIDPGPGLAFTGSDLVAPGIIALLLLGAGAAFMLIRRRRATE
ncbi:DUF11 domain-containing protein [Cryocola sp. 340MFSha3.1]|uniref:beta strand repeat-containing protein n=1 Tax=Cryocola sp. 340MFSha3.1 TaxID=1169145 RepID=UPI000370BC99|nr:DUF11 domain-containing protein [Cryocola sp. 340MFSha3.1]